MNVLAVFSCLLAVAAVFSSDPYYGGGWHGGAGVLSKRQEAAEPDPSLTTEKLYQLINQTLEDAIRGISGDNLTVAAKTIQLVAAAILRDRQANVSRDDVVSLVNDTQVELGLQPANILDDALTKEVGNIDIEFKLLQVFRLQGQSLEAAGESSDLIVATILALARALEGSVKTTEGIIFFLTAASQQADGDTGENGGTRDLHKREWSVGVDGHYGGGGDWGAGLSVSYSWGRR